MSLAHQFVTTLVRPDAIGPDFMHVHFQTPPQPARKHTLAALFQHTGQQIGMDVQFRARVKRSRVLFTFSQHGPCLNDLRLAGGIKCAVLR